MATDSSLPETSAFRLMVLGTDLANDFAEHLRESGLTPKHLGTLAMVDQGFARTQDDIARLMRVSPSLVVRLADQLEQRDLIERQRDPANRRKHILTVTEAGKSLLAETGSRAAAVDAELAARLGARLGGQLDEALARLMEGLMTDRQRPGPR
ncbi:MULTISPECIES: MarR family winged helix-turn-helix transcriptional regulator [Amycolatopsis]|uniref:MarR family transcriptional regulator n=1 Tax=Amycolatopsis dendrobii TaxID=2760662 RepID=A0A7W3ZBK3_9PSEU|nr:MULTISPECIES: MarR family transcriptional regulator [Amycolatopsis]MBB1155385.1 MarR family transcriptional regulator [Amycolatopsis dendrobii]UKD54678.1 MarR family transcriptional regulator [Amycolatopsis sp. FU40]